MVQTDPPAPPEHNNNPMEERLNRELRLIEAMLDEMIREFSNINSRFQIYLAILDSKLKAYELKDQSKK